MSLDAYEKSLLRCVDTQKMWEHAEFLCSFDKTSGTDGELRAVKYVLDTLEAYGVSTNVHSFDAYLSYPISAGLFVDGLGEVAAKTRAFSESTDRAGIVAEIVYVPGGADMFTETETAERLAKTDIFGKIVLSEGGGRDNMLLSRKFGAVGYIHMWPSDEDVIHEGIVTPVWGTPTPETVQNLPGIPVVSIKKNDGLAIRKLLRSAPVRARLRTDVETGWRRVSLPEAVIPGRSPEYVLIGGHIDSWHLGATDNVTGTVAMLELARILHRQRDKFERGVRIAWWPGHSTGRYAGSAWYCDHHWHDLNQNCVTYINIDSPGVLGAHDYSEITSVAENDAFAIDVVQEITGQTPVPQRPSRAGDQSFWGPGVSSLFMLLSNRPEGQRAQVGGSGMGWWWHAEEDTIDKIELEVLEKDVKIYLLATARLCRAAMMPLDIVAMAKEIEAEIVRLGDLIKDVFDIGEARECAAKLVSAAEAFERRLVTSGDRGLNSVLLKAVRLLTPVRYSPVEPFEHGPATPIRPIPMLQTARALLGMDRTSDDFGFLSASIVRKQNSVVARLCEARRLLDED